MVESSTLVPLFKSWYLIKRRLAGLCGSEGSKAHYVLRPVLFNIWKEKKMMSFSFIHMLNLLRNTLRCSGSVGLMRAFLLFFNLFYSNVILCNLGLIHAVHFYLGLFILLPLVQQCCYIFFYILVVLSYHHHHFILLQWMLSFHRTSKYC